MDYFTWFISLFNYKNLKYINMDDNIDDKYNEIINKILDGELLSSEDFMYIENLSNKQYIELIKIYNTHIKFVQTFLPKKI
jgi:hypothetical protein